MVNELTVFPEAVWICEPRISKSGSATVIKKPKKKLKIAIFIGVFEVATSTDICSPIGFMDRSMPNKNTERPNSSKMLPIIKRIKTSASTSTIIKHSNNTNITTGNKLRITSLVFSNSRLMANLPYFLRIRFR